MSCHCALSKVTKKRIKNIRTDSEISAKRNEKSAEFADTLFVGCESTISSDSEYRAPAE
jgi:hypothetical protein